MSRRMNGVASTGLSRLAMAMNRRMEPGEQQMQMHPDAVVGTCVDMVGVAHIHLFLSPPMSPAMLHHFRLPCPTRDAA